MTPAAWLLGNWSPLLLLYGSLCVLGAAIVRGYSGFGFSLLSITALSLALPPVAVVPSIFLLEVAASLRLLPEVWSQVHWRSIRLLLVGCLLATPLGVWALANAPLTPMKLALAAFVLLSAILLTRGVALKSMPGAVGTLGTGVATGLLNGGFGMGGPPLVVFYLSTPAGMAAGRASIIAFIIATDLMGLGFQAREGLITRDTFRLSAWFLAPLLLGVWLGSRAFRRADPVRFRLWTLRLLMLLALLMVAQVLAALAMR
jgi:uncharacterized membrane protein YfcA